jgi:hypothetical protein
MILDMRLGCIPRLFAWQLNVDEFGVLLPGKDGVRKFQLPCCKVLETCTWLQTWCL